MYWVDNPIWLAGTLSVTAMATFSTFFVNLSLTWERVSGLIFVSASIASVIMALKFGKWVATIGALVRVVLMAFFTLTVFIYAGEHGLHGFGGGAFKPTWVIFLAAAPILIFDLEGFELPSAAAEELKNPRPGRPLRHPAVGHRHRAVLRRADPGDPAGAFSGLQAVQRFGIRSNALQQVFVVYGGHLTGLRGRC